MPRMSPALRRSLVACVLLACAASVLLFSGAGPVNPGSAAGWHPILRSIAEILTLPIPTADIADVRDVVLMAALGALFLITTIDIFGRRRRTLAPTDAKTAASPPDNPAPASSAARQWLLLTGSAVVLISVLSMAANQSANESAGWIYRTASGLAWALLIARHFDERMVRAAMWGMVLIGAASVALAIARRADLIYENFNWPIGPITPTATMAALWATMAGAAAVGLVGAGRRAAPPLLILLAISFVCIYGLIETGRRGQALAALGAALLLIAHQRWMSTPRQWERIAIIAVLIVAAGGGVAYVAREMGGADRVASGSVVLRLEYWRLSLGMIGERLSLGAGPEMFGVQMTNAVAPLRGISPHLYHGNLDWDAHNEWIQAAVEIGVPGALFWLALPIGVVTLAWRPPPLDPVFAVLTNGHPARPRRAFSDPRRRATAMALTAGLLTVLVAECSGIMLRGPILPVWYWTLIGLLCAISKPRTPWAQSAARPAGASRGFALAKAIVLLAGAVFLFYLVSTDLAAARVDAPAQIVDRGAPDRRLFAMRSISLRRRAAEYASGKAAALHDADSQQAAARRWKMLYELMPGWIDTCARYAGALLNAGQPDAARRIASEALRRDLNMHEPAANILFARHFTDDPREKLLCIRRALRHAELGPDAQQILAVIGDAPSVQAILDEEIPKAQEIAEAMKPVTFDDASGEILRIGAFIAWNQKKTDLALKQQRAAAAFYTWLEATTPPSPYRRGHNAETDVYFTLARMLVALGPRFDAEAYQAIVAAERYAVLGIRHEFVANPDPSLGFIGGVVVPTEFPERLHSLWRLSAYLHVAAGQENLIAARIMSYLPQGSRTVAGVERELEAIRRQVAADRAKAIPADATTNPSAG